jgi:hypothetical protein
MSDSQLMMHGPLTLPDTERVQAGDPYAERVFRIVQAFPPLTEEQLSQLASLLQL